MSRYQKDERPGSVRQVGFYGCRDGDRVVRVRHRRRRLIVGSSAHQVDCPGCGLRHWTLVMWRQLNEGESLRGSSEIIDDTSKRIVATSGKAFD